MLTDGKTNRSNDAEERRLGGLSGKLRALVIKHDLKGIQIDSVHTFANFLTQTEGKSARWSCHRHPSTRVCIWKAFVSMRLCACVWCHRRCC